jgi:DNA-binding CsgD family transcriptional regulator/tetratricopeptide (TPR) repeat protein
VVVAGEAGAGKNRQLTAFTRATPPAGCLVLAGGCIELGEGGVPYAPIVEALRSWIRNTRDDEVERIVGSGRAEVARLVPDLGPVHLAGPSTANPLSIGSSQGRFFELLLGMLARLAATSPVVLVIEDLHWSDRSTLDLATFLVRNVRELPVMLVLTYRSDEVHRRHPLFQFLAEVERSGRVEQIELRPLNRHELGAMLKAIAGPEIDSRLVDTIHARSNGNAFFAEELLVSARDRTTELPPTLRAVLLARVMELSTEAQELLRVASAGGQRVDPRLLRSATGMDDTVLYAALREGVVRQVLVPDARSDDERYIFRHSLLQEAVYDDLLPGERTRLHAEFARTLEAAATASDTDLDHDASSASELAYHWYAAHDMARAFEAALRAAHAAEATYAFPEALVLYERALELWDRVPATVAVTGRDRVEVLAAAASVARFSDPARAVAHLRTALALVDESAEPERAALLHVRLGRAEWINGQGDLALEAHRTAVRLVPAGSPPEARARALAGLAQILNLQDRYAEARPLAEEAVVLARAASASQIEGHALNSRAVARSQEGDIDGAMEDLDAALRIAQAIGDVDDIGRAYTNQVWVLKVGGRYEEAIALAFEAVNVARRLGFLAFLGTHLLCNAADLLFHLGRWEESEAAVHQVELIGAFGINEILVRELGARLALGRGRFEEAERELRAIAPRAARTMDRQCIGPVQSSLAELALWRHQPADALDAVGEGIRLVAHGSGMTLAPLLALGLRACADLALVARARKSDEALAEALRQGTEYRDLMRSRQKAVRGTRQTPGPQSAAWSALGEAEWCRLLGDSDPAAWAASVEAWERLGQPYQAAYARFREVETLVAAHADRSRAAAVVANVISVTSALGAEPLREEAETFGRRARIVAGEAAVAATPGISADDATRQGLTAREIEVLALVAAGRTNRQIGEQLFISEKTASVHVSNIMGKLGVAGRGEAAVVAHRLGLV